MTENLNSSGHLKKDTTKCNEWADSCREFLVEKVVYYWIKRIQQLLNKRSEM